MVKGGRRIEARKEKIEKRKEERLNRDKGSGIGKKKKENRKEELGTTN